MKNIVLKKIAKKIALTVASLGCLVSSPLTLPSAHAASTSIEGFICNLAWLNPSQFPELGNVGSISGWLYTESYCRGSFVGYFRLMSVGQSADPTAYAHTETQLSNLFQVLHQHQTSGLRVQMQNHNPNASSALNKGFNIVNFSQRYN